jgi:hypothetical protein
MDFSRIWYSILTEDYYTAKKTPAELKAVIRYRFPE